MEEPVATADLTEEEKKAAIKAAMNKRGAIAQKINKDDKSALASSIKAEKEKRGKKNKVHGTTLLH